MTGIFDKAKEHASLINAYILASPKRILGFSLVAAFISLSVVSFYTWYYITHPIVPYYETDGWGHLIPKMQKARVTWPLLLESFHAFRGVVVPFIFGLSYCILGIPESVQILNMLFQATSAFGLAWFFATYFKNPLLGLFIGFSWAFWPHLSYLYGYYVSEPILGLVFISVWILAALLIQKPGKGKALLYGSLLNLLLQVKSSMILAVFLLLLACVVLYRNQLRSVLPYIYLAFLLTYLPWPGYMYLKYHRFIPFTLGGGLVLHQGTYLAGDGMQMDYLRTIPEYQQIESKSYSLDPVSKDAYFRALALVQIKQEPLMQLKLVAKKFLRFWYYILPHEWLPSSKTFFVLTPLLILAVLGFVHLRGEPAAQVAGLMFMGVWGLHGILHSEFRYNFPVLPLLLYFASIGFLKLGDKLFIHKA